MESSKEETDLDRMQDNLKKAKEIYFKYFSSQKMASTKATERKRAMMGKPLIPSSCGKTVAKKSRKGKTPHIGVKQIDKMRPMLLPNP